MDSSALNSTLAAAIMRNRNPDGGFGVAADYASRSDATALAALALSAAGLEPEAALAAAEWLKKSQAPQGALCVDPAFPGTFWPTSLGLLAFNALGFEDQAKASAEFLLKTTGAHWPKSGKVFGHDTSLRGWPWTKDCHSWVEPTSLAMLALAAAGYGDSPRLGEAATMLLDRQLPSGGLNYGNTTVFGAELLPLPEATGHALAALAGRASLSQVEKSLSYLENLSPPAHTPLTLAWSSLGLAAWGRLKNPPYEAVAKLLNAPNPQGYYDTGLLAQLMLACQAGPDGLPRVLAPRKKP